MRTKVLQSTNGTVQTNIDATFINMHETPNGVFTLAKTSAFTWPRLIPIRMELGLLIMLRVVTVDLDRDRHQCEFPLVLYTFYRYWSQYRYISVGQCKGTIRSLLKATATHRSACPKPRWRLFLCQGHWLLYNPVFLENQGVTYWQVLDSDHRDQCDLHCTFPFTAQHLVYCFFLVHEIHIAGKYLICDSDAIGSPAFVFDMKTGQLIHKCGQKEPTMRRAFTVQVNIRTG